MSSLAPRRPFARLVCRIYIRATPQAIWDALTRPEWTERYGYTGLVDYDLRPGGSYKVRAWALSDLKTLLETGKSFAE